MPVTTASGNVTGGETVGLGVAGGDAVALGETFGVGAGVGEGAAQPTRSVMMATTPRPRRAPEVFTALS